MGKETSFSGKKSQSPFRQVRSIIFQQLSLTCVILKIGPLIILGVEDGQTVRMPVGKKEVFITFRVEKSDYFRRDGADVHSDTTISIAQAILGGSTRIQGIYENMAIDVRVQCNNRVLYGLPFVPCSLGSVWYEFTYED